MILENTDCHDKAGEVSRATVSSLGFPGAWKGLMIHESQCLVLIPIF